MLAVVILRSVHLFSLKQQVRRVRSSSETGYKLAEIYNMKPAHLVSMVTRVQRQLKDEDSGDSQQTRIILLNPQCKLQGFGDKHEAVQRLTVRQKRQRRTEYSHTPVAEHSGHTSNTKLAVSVLLCMKFFTSFLPTVLQFLRYRPLFTDFDISPAGSVYYQPENLGELSKFLYYCPSAM